MQSVVRAQGKLFPRWRQAWCDVMGTLAMVDVADGAGVGVDSRRPYLRVLYGVS